MTTEVILAVISALAGGGLTAIFMIRPNRRAKNVETDGEVARQWKELALKNQENYDTIRKEKRDLWERLNKKENECTYYKTCHCENMACPNRVPPLGAILRPEIEDTPNDNPEND